MADKISIREFARRVGASDTLVLRLINNEIITKGVTYKKSGRAEVDYDVVLEQWIASGREVKGSPTVKETKPVTGKTEKPQTPVDPGGGGQVSIVEANRRKAIYDMQNKGLDLAERQGTLVNKQKVFKQLFDFGQNLRNNILTIPDRIIDDIRAMENRNDAHQKLYDALADELEKLSDTPTFE